MPDVDVQIHGAGWAGRAIARGLADAGVSVRLVDPSPSANASAVSAALAWPTHPEHPHRLEAALGTPRAAELVAFIGTGLATLPGLAPTGVAWRVDAHEREAALAAAGRIGLRASSTPDGMLLAEGGAVDLGILASTLRFPVHPSPSRAEVDVYATGPAVVDPWLADKLTPVRVQALRFDAPLTTVPVVTQQATVWWCGADAVGARWATPHLEVGETEPVPEPRVTAMLDKLTRAAFPGAGAAVPRAGIVAESCDGLPIVGPIPGRPREIVCAGFGAAGLAYALPCARAVVDGLLGRPGEGVPSTLRSSRFT